MSPTAPGSATTRSGQGHAFEQVGGFQGLAVKERINQGSVATRNSAQVADGEKPYLIARVGLDRSVLLETAGSCLQVGSGGVICISSNPEFVEISLR
jgi:hypothetical protein